MKKYRLFLTPEFEEWMKLRSPKERIQIQERLHIISYEGHFGDHHSVSKDNSIWELRWRNGRRIYYSFIEKLNILIILGGDKNGQKKDIASSARILSKRS